MTCETCGNDEGYDEAHTCPFAEDVYDDSEESCNCCDRCTQSCADSV